MILSELPAEKFFYVHDGTVIKSLKELPDALRHMSHETFTFHVNNEKNDFYNWIVGVFNHAAIARKIKAAKSKEMMAKKVFMELYA
jgi:hypothetical protein